MLPERRTIISKGTIHLTFSYKSMLVCQTCGLPSLDLFCNTIFTTGDEGLCFNSSTLVVNITALGCDCR